MNEADRTGCTVLHRAVSTNLKKIVSALLKSATVELDAVDETKRTALHWACALGHTEITKHLLEKGADDSIQDETGATPLHYAAQQGHVGCMAALMEQKEPRCDVYGNFDTFLARIRAFLSSTRLDTRPVTCSTLYPC